MKPKESARLTSEEEDIESEEDPDVLLLTTSAVEEASVTAPAASSSLRPDGVGARAVIRLSTSAREHYDEKPAERTNTLESRAQSTPARRGRSI